MPARPGARTGDLDPPVPLQPRYLGSAFALGSQRVVAWQSVAIAVAGGMLAAFVAVLSPLREILSGDPLAASAPERAAPGGRVPWLTACGGLVCIAGAGAILLYAPRLAILGMLALVAALVLLLAGALTVLSRLARADGRGRPRRRYGAGRGAHARDRRQVRPIRCCPPRRSWKARSRRPPRACVAAAGWCSRGRWPKNTTCASARA